MYLFIIHKSNKTDIYLAEGSLIAGAFVLCIISSFFPSLYKLYLFLNSENVALMPTERKPSWANEAGRCFTSRSGTSSSSASRSALKNLSQGLILF